jgi:hypothetical protein
MKKEANESDQNFLIRKRNSYANDFLDTVITDNNAAEVMLSKISHNQNSIMSRGYTPLKWGDTTVMSRQKESIYQEERCVTAQSTVDDF